MISQVLAIHPNIRIHIHSVETHGDFFARIGRRQCESLAIPAGTTDHETSRWPATTESSIERARRFAIRGRKIFDTQIMWQLHAIPSSVIEPRRFRAGSVRTQKTPVGIKGLVVSIRS